MTRCTFVKIRRQMHGHPVPYRHTVGATIHAYDGRTFFRMIFTVIWIECLDGIAAFPNFVRCTGGATRLGFSATGRARDFRFDGVGQEAHGHGDFPSLFHDFHF